MHMHIAGYSIAIYSYDSETYIAIILYACVHGYL